MARTQAADYEERREAIVNQAAELFSRRGFQAASMNELAAACGISKSLFYHYYASKDDALYAVMASHMDALVATVEELAGGELSGRDRLGELVRRFVAHYVAASAWQKVLLNELGSLPPARRAEIVGKQRFLIASLERLLGELHPSLAAAPGRCRAATMLLFGMMNWTHTWYKPDGAVDPDTLSGMILAMLDGGLPAINPPAADP